MLKCHLCKGTSDTEKNLCIHYEKVHKGFSFHSQYCNKKCGSRNNLRWHEHTHEVFKRKCDMCHKSFQYPGGLQTHMKIHENKFNSMLVLSSEIYDQQGDDKSCQKA